MSWEIRVEEGANAFDLDIARRRVEVLRRKPGELTQEVGQLVRFRRPLAPLDAAAARAFLATEGARELLAAVQDGTGVDTLWSGDVLGTWTEEAFEAACALHEALEAMTT